MGPGDRGHAQGRAPGGVKPRKPALSLNCGDRLLNASMLELPDRRGLEPVGRSLGSFAFPNGLVAAIHAVGSANPGHALVKPGGRHRASRAPAGSAWPRVRVRSAPAPNDAPRSAPRSPRRRIGKNGTSRPRASLPATTRLVSPIDAREPERLSSPDRAQPGRVTDVTQYPIPEILP
jgi:hypothetical protein